MKRIYSYLGSLFILFLAFTACQEDILRPSEAGIPLAADIDVNITVDQETNQVTFTMNNKGSYPVWIFEEATKTTYSKVNGLTKIYSTAGTYTVEIKIGNANGISDGSITREFTIDKSLGGTTPCGYDPDNDCNMWKTASFTNEFYYAPAWSQIDNPGFAADGNSYQITLPTATTDQWQAQVKFLTDMTTNASTNYDFSAIFNSTKDHGNVTVKLVKTGDDDTFYFQENISLKAYENYTFIKTDMTGLDMDNVSLVLDFGGNAEETVVTVSRIVLKENSCDDGTVIEEPGDDDVNWLPDSDCNLWKTVSYTNFFYYAPGWSQIADPAVQVSGNSYTISLPSATDSQWQAQVHFKTDNISTGAGTTYDFRCILNSTQNISAVTVKLTKVDDDDTYYFTKNISLSAYEDYVLKMPAMEGLDIDKINLVFDFGGNPANTEVTVSSIILKESACNE